MLRNASMVRVYIGPGLSFYVSKKEAAALEVTIQEHTYTLADGTMQVRPEFAAVGPVARARLDCITAFEPLAKDDCEYTHAREDAYIGIESGRRPDDSFTGMPT